MREAVIDRSARVYILGVPSCERLRRSPPAAASLFYRGISASPLQYAAAPTSFITAPTPISFFVFALLFLGLLT